MPKWTPETEKLISDIGDFIDKQMRDVVDPSASTLGTSSRVAFNVASTGKGLFQRAVTELEVDLKTHWEDSMKKIIDLAESNGSHAADKIKKAMPVAKQLADEFGFTPDNREMGKLQMMGLLKQIKKKNIKYD